MEFVLPKCAHITRIRQFKKEGLSIDIPSFIFSLHINEV